MKYDGRSDVMVDEYDGFFLAKNHNNSKFVQSICLQSMPHQLAFLPLFAFSFLQPRLYPYLPIPTHRQSPSQYVRFLPLCAQPLMFQDTCWCGFQHFGKSAREKEERYHKDEYQREMYLQQSFLAWANDVRYLMRHQVSLLPDMLTNTCKERKGNNVGRMVNGWMATYRLLLTYLDFLHSQPWRNAKRVIWLVKH